MNQAYKIGLAKVGDDVTIYPMAKIVSPATISIGDSVLIDDFVLLGGGISTLIGNFIHIASFSLIGGGGKFVMEDFAGLSGGVKIYTGNEDYSGGCLTNPAVPYPYRKPIRSNVHIGKHAIIGASSIIFPGVNIGEGAVIGANSLVTKDCDPWGVYVGSPAKKIKRRPSDKILELERQLREELFDTQGKYIPKKMRAKDI